MLNRFWDDPRVLADGLVSSIQDEEGLTLLLYALSSKHGAFSDVGALQEQISISH